MKKILTLICWMVTFCAITKAQDFKLAKSTGRLEIKDINHLEVEGYDGKEIIFSASNRQEKNDRAKGLRVVNGSGLEDNTGLGISVVDKGDVIEVRQLKKMDGPDVTVKVPKGISVYYSHSSPYGNDVKFSNLDNKLEVSTLHNGIHLTNVTGPLEISSVHGEIEASFSEALKNDISLKSTHGPVDISLPSGSKSNVKLETKFGEIYVDPDFKIDMSSQDGLTKYSGDVRGKINGGGMEMDLESTHNDVYLRKK